MGNRDGLHGSLVPPPVELLGIPIHPISPQELIHAIVTWGREERLRRVYNVNVHAMNLAADLPDFREALQGADLVFCDGFGVKWGAALAGLNIPWRMTPPDWIDGFAKAAAEADQPVFALGDEVGVAEHFQFLLHERHPGYIAAGSHHGFFEKSGPETDEIIERINASGAVHLLVGFGMPLQERWIEANAHRLQVRTVIPVGALFRWYTGVDKRAPRWMTDHGLEWAARLAGNPWRHFRRYAIGNPRFLSRVLRERLRVGNFDRRKTQ